MSRDWSKEDDAAYIEAVQKWARNHGGKPPKVNDWKKADRMHYPRTWGAIHRFGSWNKLMKAAGFTPRTNGRPEGAPNRNGKGFRWDRERVKRSMLAEYERTGKWPHFKAWERAGAGRPTASVVMRLWPGMTFAEVVESVIQEVQADAQKRIGIQKKDLDIPNRAVSTREPWKGGSPKEGDPRRCKSLRRDGEQCKTWAVNGQDYCPVHGGVSLKMKRKAEKAARAARFSQKPEAVSITPFSSVSTNGDLASAITRLSTAVEGLTNTLQKEARARTREQGITEVAVPVEAEKKGTGILGIFR